MKATDHSMRKAQGGLCVATEFDQAAVAWSWISACYCGAVQQFNEAFVSPHRETLGHPELQPAPDESCKDRLHHNPAMAFHFLHCLKPE
ncbi:hypothetical protein BaRGS_00009231 [Batillaria attramentaria]|uniref:Uncharacterized protein n=1 Tax=Batillaria attramentaria TaxID=370345 RepID=A0ABD0LJ80_9CAEN